MKTKDLIYHKHLFKYFFTLFIFSVRNFYLPVECTKDTDNFLLYVLRSYLGQRETPLELKATIAVTRNSKTTLGVWVRGLSDLKLLFPDTDMQLELIWSYMDPNDFKTSVNTAGEVDENGEVRTEFNIRRHLRDDGIQFADLSLELGLTWQFPKEETRNLWFEQHPKSFPGDNPQLIAMESSTGMCVEIPKEFLIGKLI